MFLNDRIAMKCPPVGAVQASLTLDIDATGTLLCDSCDDAMFAFQNNFKIDVAAAVGATPDRVGIVSVVSGSTVVEFFVRPAADGTPVAASAVSGIASGTTIAGGATTAAPAGVSTAAAPPIMAAPVPAAAPAPAPSSATFNAAAPVAGGIFLATLASFAQ